MEEKEQIAEMLSMISIIFVFGLFIMMSVLYLFSIS
jgi:hypothetical protein